MAQRRWFPPDQVWSMDLTPRPPLWWWMGGSKTYLPTPPAWSLCSRYGLDTIISLMYRSFGANRAFMNSALQFIASFLEAKSFHITVLTEDKRALENKPADSVELFRRHLPMRLTLHRVHLFTRPNLTQCVFVDLDAFQSLGSCFGSCSRDWSRRRRQGITRPGSAWTHSSPLKLLPLSRSGWPNSLAATQRALLPFNRDACWDHA